MCNEKDKLFVGEFQGPCNRTACREPGATFYNHATKKYYCGKCADMINEVNPESITRKGVPLCMQIVPWSDKMQALDVYDLKIKDPFNFIREAREEVLEIQENTIDNLEKKVVTVGEPLKTGNYEEFLITAAERFKMESTMTRADKRSFSRKQKPKRKYGYK